ncbi:MAG: hypothetical protein K0Q79_725 [Flavipsychrobacter sp.]|jgi:hypothetical protein|nr:hypothetical protein [Flavipsychrobacter sp.]
MIYFTKKTAAQKERPFLKNARLLIILYFHLCFLQLYLLQGLQS